MDDEPFLMICAVAGGFLCFCVGFRFLCRISGWPLANAILSVAGLGGFLALDAALAGSALQRVLDSTAMRLGLVLPKALLLACFEGCLGLILGVADIASARKRRRGLDE
jgi:hypothetical protein